MKSLISFYKSLQAVLIFTLVFFPSFTYDLSQTKYDKNFYGGLFYLTEYMTSKEFDDFSKTHTDLELVDHVYEKALSFFDYDYSETFFCLIFTLIPYNHIDLKLPLIGGKIIIPLPSPPTLIFNKKLKSTPKKLFFDSPKNEFGDKDKLAHFFANAFLKHNVDFFNLSKFLGIFVEYFELTFFMNGSFDNRDLIANHLGEIFTQMIKNNPNAKPSDALKLYQLFYLSICL